MFVGISNSLFALLYSINNINNGDVHVLPPYNALGRIYNI